MTAPLRHVLCVDDENDILQVARLSLEAVGGFTVTLCEGSAKALDAIRAARPDLVLLDVMMPEMDGPTTLARLLADPELRRIPVVFMTAKVQPPEMEHYLGLGAVGVIAKPFDPMALAGQITEIWKRHHEQR